MYIFSSSFYYFHYLKWRVQNSCNLLTIFYQTYLFLPPGTDRHLENGFSSGLKSFSHFKNSFLRLIYYKQQQKIMLFCFLLLPFGKVQIFNRCPQVFIFLEYTFEDLIYTHVRVLMKFLILAHLTS